MSKMFAQEYTDTLVHREDFFFWAFSEINVSVALNLEIQSSGSADFFFWGHSKVEKQWIMQYTIQKLDFSISGAGEMVQKLRPLTALFEGQLPVVSTHTATHNCL